MRELESSAEDWGTSKTQSNQHITILDKQWRCTTPIHTVLNQF